MAWGISANIRGPAGPGVAVIVTSLPASPTDGQEISYLADAANGVVWRLKYRAASTSAYKWEFVGGSEIQSVAGVAPAQAVGANTWALYGGLGVTLPLAGDYWFATTCGLYANANCVLDSAALNADISASTQYRQAEHYVSAGSYAGFASNGRVNARPSGEAWGVGIYTPTVGGVTVTPLGGVISARPVRVG